MNAADWIATLIPLQFADSNTTELDQGQLEQLLTDFAAHETAAKEAAEQRAAQDKEFYTRTKAEWKARAEAAEAERDRLKEMLRLAIEGANGQQERIEAERDQIANAYKQCSWERDMFEAERDRAVRALEFLKSYNREIYDCAIRFAEEPVPVPAPTIIKISEDDMRGVFGHNCDQANCPVCHPDMTLTETAELYERAATPKPNSVCRICGVKSSEHSLADELHAFQ